MKFRANIGWIALAVGMTAIAFQVFTGNVFARVIFSEFFAVRTAFHRSLSQESIGSIQDLPSPFQLVESESKPRIMTLVNQCSEDMWAAAAGNIGARKCIDSLSCFLCPDV